MAQHMNMVPIISVTPHSPGSKYNNILEDSIAHLQHIRETIHSIPLANSRKTHYAAPFSPQSLLSSRQFASCSSLPDISGTGQSNSIWPNQHRFNSDRRKSWTAIEDLSECTKSSHKSVSLSSLDSEEPDGEHLHDRNSRNSTGGISTHSLNETEFIQRNFDRISLHNNKVSLMQCRLPLQKSISTPSIAPVRDATIKDAEAITISRHLSDSDNDNADDSSHLCIAQKSEPFIVNTEKRQKRGSLFFRKGKGKSKTKGQTTTCDACGCSINTAALKEHSAECKGKNSKQQIKNAYKKISNNSHASAHLHHQHIADANRDVYDGHSVHGEHISCSDDTPLINNEFLSEPHVTHHTLGGDPILGMARENEHDTWSPRVGKEIVKSLTAKQVKLQEHIYELIITEKRHCQILLLMQKVFVESLQRHFSNLNLERLFPRLQELTDLHSGFLRNLRLKQNEQPIVDSVADILLDFFSGESAMRLKNAYGEFCSNHQTAVETFKFYQNGDHAFSEWHKHKQTNPLLKRKGIPECTLFVVQRLTKYPILIEDQLKLTKDNIVEQEKLHRANTLIKEILIDVNSRVAEKENDDRHLDIFKRIDAKSSTFYHGEKFKKSDIMGVNRKLKFEGIATLMQGRSKTQSVHIVVLSDCLFFLVENSNKYSFFTPDNKAGVVSLHKLLIRDKAGTDRGVYIISSNPYHPEMYELKVQNPKDTNIWIKSIRAAVLNCHSEKAKMDENLTKEQKLSMVEAKQATIKDLIAKMRLKDMEQAILLEQKVALQVKFLQERGIHGLFEDTGCSAETFLPNFGSYKELITDDCDTTEMSRRVLEAVQEISHIASGLYKSASGQDLPIRSFSSVGERHSDLFQSPKLPTRAETFGGFDEKKNKIIPPLRDAIISTINNTINMHTKENSQPHTADAHHSDASNKSFPNQEQALIVFHNLNTLLCIINQQMTTISSLQNSVQDNPKNLYRHNDQLEELRNLQDKFQEEKTTWMKQREAQEKAMDERQHQQNSIQEQIRHQQEDIEKQREQLFRTMEKLDKLSQQNVGLTSSASSSFSGVLPSNLDDSAHLNNSAEEAFTSIDGSMTADRRKEKWRTATMSKSPSTNIASTIPKSSYKHLPMKLASHSSKSSSSERTSLTNAISTTTSQLLPLHLADKKNHQPVANHTRTGSSPAVIQHPSSPTGHPATRTNTYPKIPDPYRMRTADDRLQSEQRSAATYDRRHVTHHSNTTGAHQSHANQSSPTAAGTSAPPPTEHNNHSANQEEIYF